MFRVKAFDWRKLELDILLGWQGKKSGLLQQRDPPIADLWKQGAKYIALGNEHTNCGLVFEGLIKRTRAELFRVPVRI